jgi:uncharacterized membrane protein
VLLLAIDHLSEKLTGAPLWLSLLFLLFITLLPFSTNLLSAHSHLQIPIVDNGINVADFITSLCN